MRSATALRRPSNHAVGAFLMTAACSLLAPTLGSAATFHVDRVDDPDPDTASACTDGAALDCSLRGAIKAANLTPGGPHTVSLPVGDFVLSRVGALEDANATGDLDILAHVVVEGAGMDSTTIDGGGSSEFADRVFHLTGPGAALELRDLEVAGGRSSRGGGVFIGSDQGSLAGPIPGGAGGGVVTALVIERVRLIDNVASSGGGALHVVQGAVTISDSEITSNEGSSGGGIFIDTGSITVSTTVFRGNRAASVGGAAFTYHGSENSGSFTDCLFEGNDALVAGAVQVLSSALGPIAFLRCRFVRNQATDGVSGTGGGLRVEAGTDVLIEDCSFHSNAAGYRGGGLWIGSGAGAQISGSTFWDNAAQAGGGAFCDSCTELLFGRSTLSANEATDGAGGGVANIAGDIGFDLTTVSGNSASAGGTIVAANGGTIEFGRSVLAGTCLSLGAVFLTDDDNLESPGDTCGLGSGDTRDVADPLLSQAWAFGGETWTRLPLPGSPVLGAAAGAVCGAVDQRGEPAPAGDCDAGSVERQGDDPEPIFIGHFEARSAPTDWSSWTGP